MVVNFSSTVFDHNFKLFFGKTNVLEDMISEAFKLVCNISKFSDMFIYLTFGHFSVFIVVERIKKLLEVMQKVIKLLKWVFLVVEGVGSQMVLS